jgi:NADH-quinone oxidoreductase subunit E
MFWQILIDKMESQKVISDEIRKEIEAKFSRFPYKQAACIEALAIVQENNGWVSDQAVTELAEILEMTKEGVDSVATFYSMIYREPVGRYVIHVCDSISCWVMGCEKIYDHLQKKLGITYGQTSSDDRFTLLPVNCLGTCDHAPALLVGKDLHRDLTLEKLDELLEKYK